MRRDLDENRLTEGTGPANMHLRRPDAVLRAIQDLLARRRNGVWGNGPQAWCLS